ncbi:hypothetical protein TSAR_000403 [Trichomalopsis sarcophagae]|uniref:EGF-like domain-containing protein n=1 Tax=Trichomalopsis sarcophagae TaxID=543379 RepID=A0A232FEA5_9HYME|nr:hypothetical protein TSAR_000403 [Trichomalopsis sarcophagae]
MKELHCSKFSGNARFQMFKSRKCLASPQFSYTWQSIFTVFFIAAFYVNNGACVIPEASQEGPLRSFKSYDDIVMFHFNVPKHVLRATWQFIAFMDSGECPQRKVNIFLKWGSYPVISENLEAAYPAHMYIENNTLQVSALTAFEPKDMTIVPVYSPEPGDWFVGAYLSYWDEKVHQKGLGHKCRYSIGSVAIWSETTGIKNIPLGYQYTLKTKETISYYKIFIPMDTWSFQVDIWGCNFKLKKSRNFVEPCIKNLELKGNSLPFHNHSNPGPIGNLSSMDTYTFSELSPYQDTWYYLMVVSSSAITFNVKVTVTNCPVRTVEEVFIHQYVHSPVYVRNDQSYMKNVEDSPMQYFSSNNQSQLKENPIITNGKELSIAEDDDNLTSCFPRYQLVRIKHSQTLSGDYLLRGRELLTSWLALTDTYPVITQFEVLPLTDIGGTLDINMSLEINKVLSKQQVNVSICISRGRVPKQITGHIKCDNSNTTRQLSTIGDMLDASLLIPYPQPGMWYIALQATCYMYGLPARCEMEQILVSLSIKLRACVFEGDQSCGEYGVCQEIRKGLLYYTACKCFGGRQGWGCTDNSNASSEFAILLTTLSLTLSNLFFIPAICMAYKRRFYTEALIYFSTMLFSSLYHACDQQFTTYCVAKFEVLQYCDFFSGILAFWVTFIAMAELPIQYESFCHMLGAIIITFGVESDKTGLISILIPIIIGMLISISSYGCYCYKMKKMIWPKRLIQLIIGLSLAGFGILIFSLVETESNYQYVHSAWHAVIAISLIFLLPPMREEQILTQISDNTLLNYKESPEDSVFNADAGQQDDHLIMEVN